MAFRPRELSSRPSIAVVGVGALGSEVCKQLADLNFAHVLVIDPDQLDERNVQSSSIYQTAVSMRGSEAFHHFKVELLLDIIHRHYKLNWGSFTEEIADVGLCLLCEMDLILSCTDSVLARIETTRVARLLNIPMIDGGVMSNEISAGRASWFAPDQAAACYLCGVSETRRAEILTYAVSPSLGCQASEFFPAMTASLRTVSETASAMIWLIHQWQKGMTSDGQSFAIRLQPDLIGQWSQTTLNLPASATCPWHDDESGRLQSIQEDRPVREAFTTEDNLYIQLPWPQCLAAQCRICGTRSKPLRRVAWVRRKAVCKSCGRQRAYEPIEAIDTLSHRDALADLTPGQLGLPKQHLYLFRRSFVPIMRKDE